MKTQLQSEYIAIRRQALATLQNHTRYDAANFDALVREALPTNPTPQDWVEAARNGLAELVAARANRRAAYNNPPEEEVVIDLPSVSEYFGAPGDEQ